MRYICVALLSAAALLSTQAQARTLEQTSNIVIRALDRSVNFTSDTTTSLRDMKVVVDAHDDAASFVATQGAVRGAQLEAAFAELRQLPQAQGLSEQALAEAILAL